MNKATASNNAPQGDKPQSQFQSTRHANLVLLPGNGVYYVRARVGGVKIVKTTGTTSEKAALEKRDEILRLARAAHEVGIVRDNTLDFNAAVKIYRENLEERVALGLHQKKDGLRPNTKTSYEGALTKILSLAEPAFLTRKLDRFSTEILTSWIKPVRQEYGATLYNTCTIVFRDIFAIGIKAKILLVNPALALEHETPQRKAVKLPTLEEFDALVQNIRTNKLNRFREDSADVILFLIYTGARITEANHLRRSDIKLDKNIIHFRKGTTKNGHEKFVPIIEECLPLVKKWLAQPARGTEEKLLPVGNVLKALANGCDRLNIPHLTQHDLRHFFASRALELTKDSRVVSEWLGHRDGGKLLGDTYSHVNAAWTQAAASKVNFGGKVAPENKAPEGNTVTVIDGKAYTQEELTALAVAALRQKDKIIDVAFAKAS